MSESKQIFMHLGSPLNTQKNHVFCVGCDVLFYDIHIIALNVSLKSTQSIIRSVSHYRLTAHLSMFYIIHVGGGY